MQINSPITHVDFANNNYRSRDPYYYNYPNFITYKNKPIEGVY